MTPAPKPFSPACERNREPIRAVLGEYLQGTEQVLEIGSGTGQHAVHFAGSFPGVTWQTSDRPEHLHGILAWLSDAGLSNTPPPLALDVRATWPKGPYDLIFTANTCHIMGWEEVKALFQGVSSILIERGHFLVYGPFNEKGLFTSPGNAAFDASLRRQDPRMGLRDLEEVVALGEKHGFEWIARHSMPANNLCLSFRKSPAEPKMGKTVEIGAI